jgi:hypothetical protein
MNKLWRGIAIFFLGGVLGTGFGVALGFFIFSYVFPPPPAAEQLADAERSNLVASGMRGCRLLALPQNPLVRRVGLSAEIVQSMCSC